MIEQKNPPSESSTPDSAEDEPIIELTEEVVIVKKTDKTPGEAEGKSASQIADDGDIAMKDREIPEGRTEDIIKRNASAETQAKEETVVEIDDSLAVEEQKEEQEISILDETAEALEEDTSISDFADDTAVPAEVDKQTGDLDDKVDTFAQEDPKIFDVTKEEAFEDEAKRPEPPDALFLELDAEEKIDQKPADVAGEAENLLAGDQKDFELNDMELSASEIDDLVTEALDDFSDDMDIEAEIDKHITELVDESDEDEIIFDFSDAKFAVPEDDDKTMHPDDEWTEETDDDLEFVSFEDMIDKKAKGESEPVDSVAETLADAEEESDRVEPDGDDGVEEKYEPTGVNFAKETIFEDESEAEEVTDFISVDDDKQVHIEDDHKIISFADSVIAEARDDDETGDISDEEESDSDEDDDKIIMMEAEDDIRSRPDDDIIEITEFDETYSAQDVTTETISSVTETSDVEEEDEFIELIDVEEETAEDEEEIATLDELGVDSENNEFQSLLRESFEEDLDLGRNLKADIEDKIEASSETNIVSEPDEKEDFEEAEKVDLHGDTAEISEKINQLDIFFAEATDEETEESWIREPQEEPEETPVPDEQQHTLEAASQIFATFNQRESYLTEDSDKETGQGWLQESQKTIDAAPEKDLQEAPDEIPDKDLKDKPDEDISIALPPDRIELAVERIITEKFSHKLEALMVQAIEKAVTREIGRLKNLLMEDDTDEDAAADQ